MSNDRFANVMDEVNLIPRDTTLDTVPELPQLSERDLEAEEVGEEEQIRNACEQAWNEQPRLAAERQTFVNSEVDRKTLDVYAAVPELDWPVTKEPMQLTTGETTPVYATVRRNPDTGAGTFLGTVRGRYTITQGSELKATLAPYVEAGLLKPTAAGLYKSRIWIQADIVGCEAAGLKGYATLATSFDGSIANVWGQAVTRIVCQNTLAHAVAECLGKARHTRNGHKLTIRGMEEMVAGMSSEFRALADKLEAAKQVECDEQQFRAYINATFTDSEDDEELGERTFAKVYQAWQEPIGERFDGTMHGAYQAVTQYLTHERGRSEASRFDSLHFGTSRDIGVRALELL